MITLMVLVLVAITGLCFVILPVWQGVRRPWTLQTPDGDEEALQQERFAALEALRDLAMDFKLGNLAEPDYRALAAPLQQRARRVLDLQKTRARPARVSVRWPDHAAAADPAMDGWLEAQILAARRVFPGPLPNRLRFCPQCGSAVATDYRFCAACGARLPLAEESNPGREGGQPPLLNGQTNHQPAPFDAVGVAKQVDLVTHNPQAVSGADVASVPGHETEAGLAVAATSTDIQPVAQRRWWAALTNSRRWLWGIGALVTLLWAAVVIWIYVTARSGQTNQTPVAVLPNVSIQALATGDNLLVLGEPKGIRTSPDGQQWMPLPVAGDMRSITRIANADDAWVAVGPGGLWRSEDGALSWKPVATTPPDLRLAAIAAVPGQPGLLWGVDNTTLYRSEDGGRIWRSIRSFQLGRPRALAAGASRLFLGTNEGVFQNDDGGRTWVNLNGVMNSAIISTDVRALAYDEPNGLLYAGTPFGVSFQKLRSFGGWGQRAVGINVTALALAGPDNQVLWVGAADGKIYRSSDRGVTWQ